MSVVPAFRKKSGVAFVGKRPLYILMFSGINSRKVSPYKVCIVLGLLFCLLAAAAFYKERYCCSEFCHRQGVATMFLLGQSSRLRRGLLFLGVGARRRDVSVAQGHPPLTLCNTKAMLI